MGRPPYPPPKIPPRLIRAYCNRKATATSIAAELGVPRHVVVRSLRKSGVAVHTKGRPAIYPNAEAAREVALARVRKRIDAGVCRSCGKRKPVAGKKRCEVCAEAEATSRRERLAMRIRAGLCRNCGKKKEADRKEMSNCERCQSIITTSAAKYRAKHG